MSGTRSPSPPAPATDAASVEVIVVAHGLPSAPERQEAGMHALATQVAALLGGDGRVVGTTLAMPGGLEEAIGGCRGAPLVYPLFMADGWFVRRALPRRLAAAGASDARVLPPLGLDPRVHALACRRVAEAAGAATPVLVAAHGSPRDPRPAAVARVLAARLSDGGRREVRCGFIDEAPLLANAARGIGRAVCLPFFARRAGHVERDLPQALRQAGFAGPVLPPLGEDSAVPHIIAAAVAEARGSQLGNPPGPGAAAAAEP